jgi:putative hemolysin
MLRLWDKKPVRMLSFLLVANNLVNILASSLATDLSLRLLQPFNLGGGTSLAIAVSVGVMTLLVLVFGEVLPKTFARHNPKLVVHLLLLLLAFYYLLWPAAWVLAKMGKRFISLAGGDPASPLPSVTEKELEYLIHKGTTEGTVDVDKERILSGAFDLENMIAKEVMVPRTEVIMFDARAPLAKVMVIIAEHKFSRYPVFQETQDKVAGIFYVKDLLPYFEQPESRRKPFRLRDFTRPAHYIPETMPLDRLLQDFRGERIHIAVVVDEYGGTAGLVTLEDIIEELVGEIYDEYDKEEKLYSQLDERSFVLQSRLPVDDLNEELGIDVSFPDDREYESVGGLVMELAESVPETGQILVYEPPSPPDEGPRLDLRFKVLESDGIKSKMAGRLPG